MAGELKAITMPKWGIEMTEGKIAEWLRPEGSVVAKGDPLVVIETDKIANEVEADFAGRLHRIVGQPGDTSLVGALIAVIGAEDAAAKDVDAFIAGFVGIDAGFEEAAAAPQPTAPPPPKAEPEPAPRIKIPAGVAISPKARELAVTRGIDVAALAGSGRRGRLTAQDVEQAARGPSAPRSGEPVSNAVTTTELDGIYASPMAKRLALQHGIDLSGVSGSGKNGRIGKADVLGSVKTVPPAGPDQPQIIPFSVMRRTVAKRLVEAKQEIPHFYLRAEAEMDWLLNLREKINRERGVKLSVNDYLLKAVAQALMREPAVNIQVVDGAVHRFPHADIAVAVALEEGLMTPVVRAADTKTVAQISAEVGDLSSRARAGRLYPEDYKGGSFCVSNLGMFGITSFDAVINPPQGAILAVGAIKRAPVERNFALTFASIMQLTLSCDHRAIDGAVGARFLAALRDELEHPARLID